MIPSQEASRENIGRASLLASRRPSKSLPHEALGWSLALPISAGFEFFHSSGGLASIPVQWLGQKA
ncbi:MAG: hypothetical protein DMG05_04985 [Acidobacteria bacterium]|nr:MAG: hypothetical protein DMG05_04985 [Acidobacteriota bacterium]